MYGRALLATSGAPHNKERSETILLPHHQLCLPRPRKRGALHGKLIPAPSE